VTNHHAQAIAEFGVLPEARTEAGLLIAEMDGSMVPIVQMAARLSKYPIFRSQSTSRFFVFK